MDFLQLLVDLNCSEEILTLLSIVKWALNLICWGVPILLIVFVTIDVAKIVTAGNLDDKMKKDVGNKIVTRLIYAIVIFLIPVIVSGIFGLLPSRVKGGTNAGNPGWWECYQEA